jgi:hypothetical protein
MRLSYGWLGRCDVVAYADNYTMSMGSNPYQATSALVKKDK